MPTALKPGGGKKGTIPYATDRGEETGQRPLALYPLDPSRRAPPWEKGDKVNPSLCLDQGEIIKGKKKKSCTGVQTGVRKTPRPPVKKRLLHKETSKNDVTAASTSKRKKDAVRPPSKPRKEVRRLKVMGRAAQQPLRHIKASHIRQKRKL